MTAARDRFKMFRFSVMQSPFSFSNIELRELKPTLNDTVDSEKLYIY